MQSSNIHQQQQQQLNHHANNSYSTQLITEKTTIMPPNQFGSFMQHDGVSSPSTTTTMMKKGVVGAIHNGKTHKRVDSDQCGLCIDDSSSDEGVGVEGLITAARAISITEDDVVLEGTTDSGSNNETKVGTSAGTSASVTADDAAANNNNDETLSKDTIANPATTLPPLPTPKCGPPPQSLLRPPQEYVPTSLSPSSRLTKSAMKRTSSYGAMEALGENIPLKLGRRSFKILPLPSSPSKSMRASGNRQRAVSTASYFDMSVGGNDSTNSSGLTADEGMPNMPPIMKKRVSFSKIQIRDYETTIGDNPSCTYGTPISLSWQYLEVDPIDLDKYEDGRIRRNMRQMHLNFYKRNYLLTRAGHTEEEIKAGKKETAKVRRGRQYTRQMLPLARIEDMIESANRKAKRILGKKGSGGKKQHHRSVSEPYGPRNDAGDVAFTTGLGRSISLLSFVTDDDNELDQSMRSRATADF
mmetsp:Transcript_6408/g.18896  ORF Transcript_6408/g.18896 Transcript_6408/m.18896 type:complete len:470 (+) Transcript_6408:151-1560(+)|eukprot:CAMPEP_0119562086 /NCGR_PEP_ID=MMETSP1352-20130426/19481_1 /TAXON_ID=265584 /ORGANISM="Stauroneis constricta, Strain CCMP1120" /LENGTH=469 /DNA_ID=CAMNT_0007610431 /DNA_START=57 /DNA_END=1466 /DNA_ORIENTATION=+